MCDSNKKARNSFQANA